MITITVGSARRTTHRLIQHLVDYPYEDHDGIGSTLKELIDGAYDLAEETETAVKRAQDAEEMADQAEEHAVAQRQEAAEFQEENRKLHQKKRELLNELREAKAQAEAYALLRQYGDQYTDYDLVLAGRSGNKIALIKAVRQHVPGYSGLREAKEAVDAAQDEGGQVLMERACLKDVLLVRERVAHYGPADTVERSQEFISMFDVIPSDMERRPQSSGDGCRPLPQPQRPGQSAPPRQAEQPQPPQ